MRKRHNEIQSTRQVRGEAQYIVTTASTRNIYRRVARMTVSMLGIVLVGCSGDTVGPGPLSAAQSYWTLQLNYEAANLALTPPYNQVQLHATPLSAAGTPLSGLGPVHYSVVDSNVSVDSTGHVTAHYVTSRTNVIATLQDSQQRITHTDTVAIQVTSTPPLAPLATFSIQPAAGDSAKQSLDAGYTLPVYATDALGNVLCDASSCALLVYFHSSDPNIASIDRSGNIKPYRTGHVTFVAKTFAWGVGAQDTLNFVIGYAKFAVVNIVSRVPIGSVTPVLDFTPPTVTIGVGGIVVFNSQNLQPIDVVFTDSTAVAGAFGNPDGNISPFAYDTLKFGNRYRKFPVAGNYEYHSNLYNVGGMILVKDFH